MKSFGISALYMQSQISSSHHVVMSTYKDKNTLELNYL